MGMGGGYGNLFHDNIRLMLRSWETRGGKGYCMACRQYCSLYESMHIETYMALC